MEHISPVILLVDDDDIQRSYLKDAFIKEFKCRILEAEDGIRAVPVILKEPVELVITDLFMPKMNGLALTHFIRNCPDKSVIPVIMISSRAGPEEQEKASKVGVTQFIPKSGDLTSLIQVAQRYLLS